MDLDAADFDFSDAELDDLPAHALQHLEASAVRATQHHAHSQRALAAPESDYGLDDGDEVVNLDDDDAAAPRYTPPRQPYDYARHGDEQPGAHVADDMDVDEQPRRSQAGATQLLSRIKKLEQVRAREKKAVDDLKSKLQTKVGEADTLRRRHEADARKYERQLADQHQQHGSELARMRAEIERLRREKEQAHTDSMFRQHDAREAGMAQRSRRAIPMPIPSRPRAADPAAISPAGTPRRAQKSRGPLGDGFDDDDVLMASPSKARDRPKTATPRQAGKRKRQLADQSPIPLPALQLSEPRSRPTDRESERGLGATIDVALLQFFREHDQRYSLLHQLLSQPSSNGQDRILEALWQHAFPTQPSKKLSSIVYDELASATATDVHELALQLCNVFLDLWKQCLSEKYYAPLSLVLDALHFILNCEPAETAVQAAVRAIPLIVTTVDLVSAPIISAARLGGKAIASLYSPTQRDIAAKIDVLDCLELLYLLATSCVSTSPEAVLRFWQGIPSGFTLMLLNKEYPQPQIALVLRILSTSALPASLGPIAAEDESQANIEDALISRLTNIFTESPKTIPDPAREDVHTVPAIEAEVWELRLLVLKVLTQFSVWKHGCDRLAQNRLCIGRLIKHLDYSLNTLYRQPLSPTQPQKIESVNTTTKLIHHIAMSTPGFDIKSKLVNTLGGQHAYLVALTRLAFSEGLLLEAGIEDAVVDMAHSILDEGLSIEEGEAFGMVFSSGSSV